MHGAHLRAQQLGASGSGLRWRHITLTLGRDATDPAQHTWQLLRGRIKALQAAWREVWSAWRTLPGAAALLTLEIAGSGHVHAHALVLGPRSVAKSWISEIVGRHSVACSNSGAAPFVDVRTVEHAQAAKELSKYHAKMPSVRLESWLGGWPATTLHPTIAARWELASYGTRLMERYGGLREALEDAPAELPTISAIDTASDDGRTRCQCCGTVGRWQWRVWRGSVASWVNYCRARGSPALAESAAWEAATSSAQAAHLEREEMRRARHLASYLRADAAVKSIECRR